VKQVPVLRHQFLYSFGMQVIHANNIISDLVSYPMEIVSVTLLLILECLVQKLMLLVTLELSYSLFLISCIIFAFCNGFLYSCL
jgi:hypothetical protein